MNRHHFAESTRRSAKLGNGATSGTAQQEPGSPDTKSECPRTLGHIRSEMQCNALPVHTPTATWPSEPVQWNRIRQLRNPRSSRQVAGSVFIAPSRASSPTSTGTKTPIGAPATVAAVPTFLRGPDQSATIQGPTTEALTSAPVRSVRSCSTMVSYCRARPSSLIWRAHCRSVTTMSQ